MEEVVIEFADFLKDNDATLNENEKEAIKELYNSIYMKEITTKNILTYVVLLMKIMDNYKNIQNIDKKKLVLFTMNKFIELNIMDEQEQKLLQSLVDNLLPNIIDTIILVDKKSIQIKNQVSCFCF
jgi:hypothetical protein